MENQKSVEEKDIKGKIIQFVWVLICCQGNLTIQWTVLLF